MKFGLYRHYKGNNYIIFATARHSETLENLVIYKRQDNVENKDIWVRPLSIFLQDVELEGKKFKRFEFISEVSH